MRHFKCAIFDIQILSLSINDNVWLLMDHYLMYIGKCISNFSAFVIVMNSVLWRHFLTEDRNFTFGN